MPVRFASRLMLVLALVGVVPVLVLGGLSFRANRDALLRLVGGLQTQAATDLARSCRQLVLMGVDNLRLAAEYLPLERLGPQDASQVLSIPLRQLGTLNLLVLVDAQGHAIAPAVFTPEGGGNRQRVTEDSLALFSRQAPVQAALSSGAAIGPPYRTSESSGGRVALAVRAGERSSRLLLAELSLAELGHRVEELALEGGLAFIVDAQGSPVASSLGQGALSDEERTLVSEGLSLGESLVRTVRGSDGTEYLAAFAPVPDLGWGAVVGRRANVAFAPAEHVRRSTFFWALVALAATGVLGFVLARGVSQPVARLSEGVAALAEGRYDQRISEEGRDELGRLARSFNHMAGELQRREAELRRWSEELQQRVDERTRQLREAQDQIARTRRLAALGSLSAGIAHELNNPLTGILGLLSLASEDVPAMSSLGQSLAMALEQARRMARIIKELRQMAEQERVGAGRPLDPLQPVRAALHELRDELPSRGVTLCCELGESVPRVLGHADQLQKVVTSLLQNALTAMPTGGTLSVGLAAVEGDAVCLSVKDTGRGIPEPLRERIFDPFFTTKDEPGRVGLGLSVAHRIVEAHHGRIRVESAEGQGTTITVILPAAGGEAHLS
ncbi:ATP-binding protein [Vitiosangium sp. GDMCC 1.1324]|uniref:ATP-binding protein n=1 Tax=Vitiosangium sp. (strain GDMCC 1.1324) TaxID=2138576 RepID=UPI000D38B105|nr:ATP-binding protein [Vitiosangium sp. GDMCC 1.1324]PTL85302.1 two-component sensor histidine kinase [Vitiosangium sp. GDMCC 1.1324]